MEYKHIICPIDGAEASDAALMHASYLCRISGAQLSILHVVEKWYRAAHLVTNSEEWGTIHEEWLNKGRELLDATAVKLRDEGLHNIKTVLREGDASHEIVALAVEERADLIVMATHRYSHTGKLFMGSVIDRVTKKSPCPIFWVF